MYSSSRVFPRPAAAALLAALLLPALAACTKADGAASAPPPGSGLDMRLSPASAPRPGTGPAARPSGGARKPAPLKPLPPPPIASARAFGLAAPPGPLLPADYSLGPLQDLLPPSAARPAGGGSSAEEALILAPAMAFLAGLREGRLETESILPDRRPLLESLLAPLLSGPRPAAYRLGRIRREGEAALAPLRLEAAAPAGVGPRLRAPRAEGELRLRREGEAWYVEDLALDPAGLARAPEPPSPPFEPGFAAP